jgi:small subunit ribosomal protein S8
MDLIANLISRIKTGQHAKKEQIVSPSSKVLKNILNILKESGYISGYEEEGDKVKTLKIGLRYGEDGSPVIRDMVRVSKSARRVYRGADDLPRVANGFGTVIVSTSKGIVTGKQARAALQGGEVLCYVM